jgi:hypothetical protein
MENSGTTESSGANNPPPPQPEIQSGQPSEAVAHADPSDILDDKNLELWEEAEAKLKDNKEWRMYKENLQKFKDVQNPENISRESLIARKAEIEKYKEEQWGFTSYRGEKIIFRNVLSQIVDCIASLTAVGAAVAALDPTKHAAIAWSGVMLAVTVSHSSALWLS